jgi:hypothetical protein
MQKDAMDEYFSLSMALKTLLDNSRRQTDRQT